MDLGILALAAYLGVLLTIKIIIFLTHGLPAPDFVVQVLLVDVILHFLHNIYQNSNCIDTRFRDLI